MISETDKAIAAKRWVSISLRTLHLIGVAGIGGAYLYHVPQTLWYPYLVLLIISGAGMLTMEMLSNTQYLLQIRGLATIAKLIILMVSILIGMETYQLFVVIVISRVISHAPGKVRYYYIIKDTNKKSLINERN